MKRQNAFCDQFSVEGN